MSTAGTGRVPNNPRVSSATTAPDPGSDTDPKLGQESATPLVANTTSSVPLARNASQASEVKTQGSITQPVANTDTLLTPPGTSQNSITPSIGNTSRIPPTAPTLSPHAPGANSIPAAEQSPPAPAQSEAASIPAPDTTEDEAKKKNS